VNLQDYELGYVGEFVELLFYSAVCFFLPLFLRHPQWIIGIVINCVLVLSAFNIRGYKLIPVIILPSVGAFFGGLLFGSLTHFLIYFIPFIWVGNALIVFGVKKLNLFEKKNVFSSVAFSAFAKALFLFLSAFILYISGVVPRIFLFSMGLVQLFTAISGGFIAVGLQKIKKNILI